MYRLLHQLGIRILRPVLSSRQIRGCYGSCLETSVIKRHKSRGLTLIEVVVAMGIFAIASLALQTGLVTHIRSNGRTETKAFAIQAAQEVLDEKRAQAPSALPTTGTETTIVNIGSRPFTVKTIYCYNVSMCIDSVTRHLWVEVSFQGETTYTTQTVFTQLR